jgi:hypothetical protein
MSDFPFAPRDGGTVTVAASTTSADEAIDAGCHWLRVVNNTNGVAFVKTARGSALTATSADFPVAPGATGFLKLTSDHNIVAVILAAGSTSGNVYVTPGGIHR